MMSGHVSLQCWHFSAFRCQVPPIYASPWITPQPSTPAFLTSRVGGSTRSKPTPSVKATESPMSTLRATPGAGGGAAAWASAGAAPVLAFAASDARPVAGRGGGGGGKGRRPPGARGGGRDRAPPAPHATPAAGPSHEAGG